MLCIGSFFLDNVNQYHPPKNDVDKARVARYFHLHPAFVASFTPNWNLMTILSINQTTGESYSLVMIHNGHYPNELEQVLHLIPSAADAPNIQVFKANSYGGHNDVPLSRLNILWDDLDRSMEPHMQHAYHRMVGADFDGFIRSLQFILLSFFLPGVYANHDDWFYAPRIGAADIHHQPWFDPARHAALKHNIKTFGFSVDSYMTHFQRVMRVPGIWSYEVEVLSHARG